MHKRTIRLIRRRRIRNTEDIPTDTPYDLVRRTPHYRPRDYAFWFALIGGMVAAGVYFLVDLVRTVR